jgi:DNA-binding winged helix-turn-helix (wHTH) protein
MQTKPPPASTSARPSPNGITGSDLRHGFRLGPWEVHPDSGDITGAGETQRLEPKVMEVLLLLAQRSGEVVERDELLDQIWPPRADVSDEALTRCISVLRRTLNDSRQTPVYIQTIPKRGYRLRASVTSLAAAEPSCRYLCTDSHGEPPAIAEGSIPENSIAVLPFSGGNTSADVDFGGDVAGQIRSRLMSGTNVLVVARTWSDAIGGSRDLRAIQAQLRVARVLEGRVQRSGNQVRICIDLWDARSGFGIWSESFEDLLTAASHFAIQDRIANAIVSKLRESFEPPSGSNVERRRSKDRRRGPLQQIFAGTSAFPQDRLLRRAEHLDRPNRPNTRIES